MRDILVTENIAGSEMELLKKNFDVAFEPEMWKSPEKIKSAIGEFRAVMVRNQTPVTAEIISAGKRLEIIGRAGVGLDNVDHKAATSAGIVVAFAPEQNTLSVAELALGLMLSLARNIPQADRSTRSGKWDRMKYMGVELHGKTLGVVGLGRIGFMTANRARAFGMNILAHDSYVNPDGPFVVESGAKLVSLDELLSKSDFVTVHVPKTPDTVNLFNYERFCRRKPAAYFINTSRGDVVDEEGLIRALKEKRIAGCATDVRAKEPPAPGPLFEMENVIQLPHIAAFTIEAQERVVTSVCRDVADVLRGGGAKNFFNFAKPKK
jgi:D-3-phosphoglycerate dehydrogenase / 2-oxoglutarate reductase